MKLSKTLPESVLEMITPESTRSEKVVSQLVTGGNPVLTVLLP